MAIPIRDRVLCQSSGPDGDHLIVANVNAGVLVKALGINGMSKSHVSRLCQALDTEVERFRTRKLDGRYSYCWLDATFLKVRQDHRVVSMAVVIAVGVNQEGSAGGAWPRRRPK